MCVRTRGYRVNIISDTDDRKVLEGKKLDILALAERRAMDRERVCKDASWPLIAIPEGKSPAGLFLPLLLYPPYSNIYIVCSSILGVCAIVYVWI